MPSKTQHETGSCVYVCRGGDCRKKRGRRAALIEALQGHAEVCEVRCQKICKGPVFGLEIDGALQWFAGNTGAKEREQAVRLLTRGKVARGLSKRRVKRRAGKLRKPG